MACCFLLTHSDVPEPRRREATRGGVYERTRVVVVMALGAGHAGKGGDARHRAEARVEGDHGLIGKVGGG